MSSAVHRPAIWARADAVWWSAAGTGERSPILFDGALVNAASSVLPMVRFPPLQLSRLLLTVYRVFCFLAHGGPWGPFLFPTIPTKPLSVYVCVRVCVCCLCIAGAGPKPLARLSLPIDARRCAPAGCCSVYPPDPLAAPRSRLPTVSQESQASLARQARQ